MYKKRYHNLDNMSCTNSWQEFIQWRKEKSLKAKDYSFTVPHTKTVQLNLLHQNKQETTITWIGHSTFLIQIGGLNIITDPVWAKRLANQKRLTGPGILPKEMPEIDLVLISHSHYDHLHFSSLERLKGNPIHLVPEGLSWKFRNKGYDRDRVQEFSWWSNHEVNGVEFTFVPAQHWTRRTLLDTNSSHWGGWVIRHSPERNEPHKDETIYFSGDSGYFQGFKEIKKQFDIDYALMPIGAYEPEWFMRNQHVTPEEAIQAFLDCGGTHFIPMHYGTFPLADDTPKEALERLHSEWKRLGLAYSKLRVLALGETFRPSLTKNMESQSSDYSFRVRHN